MIETRTGVITLKGTPTDLAGPELKIGDAAPNFSLQNNALEIVTLATFAGKTLVIATVPSPRHARLPRRDEEVQRAGRKTRKYSSARHQHGLAVWAKTLVRCRGRGRCSDAECSSLK